MNTARKWTAEEEAVLERLYPDHGSAAVAAVVGRSQKAVIMHARVRGIRRLGQGGGRRWRDEEVEALERLYPEHGAPAVAAATGRSEKSVRSQARVRGIRRAGRKPRAGFRRVRRLEALPPSNPALRGWGWV